jgi:hypothetical protein
VGEDGLAGFCDIEQRLCLSLALWNGRDPILKERAFGLTGRPQGNHGEDVKEYWWYLDAIPSHCWNRWRYHYPQGPFPYQDLIDTNGHRSRYEPEYELLDTGAFDGDRYWITEVHYAKAGPDDLLMSIQLTNKGPEAEPDQERADLHRMHGPAGIVAASTAASFTAPLVALHIGGADKLLAATFLVIVGTVAIYGIAAAPPGQRARPPPTRTRTREDPRAATPLSMLEQAVGKAALKAGKRVAKDLKASAKDIDKAVREAATEVS